MGYTSGVANYTIVAIGLLPVAATTVANQLPAYSLVGFTSSFQINQSLTMVGSTYMPTTVNANDNTCNIYYNTAM